MAPTTSSSSPAAASWSAIAARTMKSVCCRYTCCKLHGLHKYAHAPADIGTAQVGEQAHPTRSESTDASDLGSCEPVWPLRARYERPPTSHLIQMAAGDTTVGFTATSGEADFVFLGADQCGQLSPGGIHRSSQPK